MQRARAASGDHAQLRRGAVRGWIRMQLEPSGVRHPFSDMPRGSDRIRLWALLRALRPHGRVRERGQLRAVRRWSRLRDGPSPAPVRALRQSSEPMHRRRLRVPRAERLCRRLQPVHGDGHRTHLRVSDMRGWALSYAVTPWRTRPWCHPRLSSSLPSRPRRAFPVPNRATLRGRTFSCVAPWRRRGAAFGQPRA